VPGPILKQKEVYIAMNGPAGFPSWKNYFSFAFASDFIATQESFVLHRQKNWGEALGEIISKPVLGPINFLVREIKNPLVILSITVSLVAAATLVFYPAQCIAAATTLFPFLVQMRPWMIKIAVFTCVESTILAVGLRALGRMCNKELHRAWLAHEIIPIHLGAKRAT
jgi:hypothetical protein